MMPPAAPMPSAADGPLMTSMRSTTPMSVNVPLRVPSRSGEPCRHAVEQAQRDAATQGFRRCCSWPARIQSNRARVRESTAVASIVTAGGLSQLRFADDGDGARNLVDRLRHARAGHDDLGDLIVRRPLCPGCARWSRSRRAAASSSWSQAGYDAPDKFSLTPPNSKTVP